jgi:deazaflavin-dependent oxidoreductase (nitroreductase family)
MADQPNWNDKVIAEFRANQGRVGGNFEGAPLLLLHTTGARTAAARVNPMMYQQVEGGWAVFASKAGADTNPDWYHNLLAHPAVSIEVGSEAGIDSLEVRARVASGAEREAIWTEQKKRFPGFAGYERKTVREIPVVILEPAAGS